MKFLAVTLLGALSLLGIGCASGPSMTQAQMNAIETREVNASLAETFNAASGALFDAGYTISMSDRQGGLLTGTKSIDRSADRFWVNASIQNTPLAMSIQMRVINPSITAIRIKTSQDGVPKTDKKAIDQIWVLMQRQVLMKEPLASNSSH